MIIAENKKARYNYEIIETIEAGLVLKGSEVKSLRQKKANISDAYATFHKKELMLTNMSIEPYEKSTVFNHETKRPRKLLLHRKEIDKLKGKLAEKGWVLVPLKVYFNQRQKVKVLLGLGKGKKSFDKRHSIKERDIKRDTEREMKRYS